MLDLIAPYLKTVVLISACLLGSTVLVQCAQISSLRSKVDAATTKLNQAEANATSNGKSAGEWQTLAEQQTKLLNDCNKQSADLATQNNAAVAIAQQAATTAETKLRAWQARYTTAAKGSCAAMLATPICAEALPNE